MAVWKSKIKGYWVAKFQHRKKQYKREGLKTRREAVLWEAKKRQELNAAPILEIPSVYFQELATMYLNECRARMQLNTVRQKAFVFRSFLEFLEDDAPILEIYSKQINDYLRLRAQKDGNKAANRDLKEIKALYNWALRQDIIDMKNPCNPIDKYPEDPYHPYVPSQEDVKKIRLIAKGNEKDLIETIYHLAARLSEAVRLTWDDVNFEQRWIRLYTRKRRGGELKEDYQPMNLTLQKVLKNRWEREGKSNSFVFQFSSYELRNMMDELCKKAKIKPFGFHAIRHHVLSILNETGKLSMKQIQRIARHKRQSTTETYLHSISRDLYDAVEMLEDN